MRAYDDDLGVTAAFNLNLLARINRELEGDFDLQQFEHVARINQRRPQRRNALAFETETDCEHFRGGAAGGFSGRTKLSGRKAVTNILSKKFFEMARHAGFHCEAQWTDEQWPFAENLLIAE